MYLIVAANPPLRHRYIGPFPTEELAQAFGEEHVYNREFWWTCPLESQWPSDDEVRLPGVLPGRVTKCEHAGSGASHE
jgi:hypothetical protein